MKVCFSAEGTNTRIAVIFRGSGKKITEDEKQSYHKGVDIYWQKSDWADTDVSAQWVKSTLKNAVRAGDANEEFVPFWDNLNPKPA